MATPSPRQILAAVRTFARQHDLLRPGPLVVAVSGGTDSTALALVLAELRDELGLVLHIAHFDHATRPKDAAADAQFVTDLANAIDAPVRIGKAKTAAKGEEEARTARYEFLRRVANDLGATAIATGHTRDDQAETVLLHLTRGAGLAGAAGMRPLRDGIARPLLVLSRADTTAICVAQSVVPREDPTNASLDFARNRIRRNVLPELERINPQVRANLARFAEIAGGADEALGAVASHAPAAKTDTDDVRAIDIATLPQDDAARDRILADAWRAASGRGLGARQRKALLALTTSSHGTRTLDLPGGAAVREYGTLRLGVQAKTSSAVEEIPLRRGETIRWHGWRISVDMPRNGLPFVAAVDARVVLSLRVRSRRPGDRVTGMGKLQDVFVDAKVPARVRDAWPVLTSDKKVLWVPGLTPSPAVGRITLEAGPDGPAGQDLLGSSIAFRRVASSSVGRPRGGKRGRP